METFESITTDLPSGKRTITSGRKFLPSSSLMFSCTKYSLSFVRPLLSRMLSSTISPQSPCVLFSPLSALVRLAASVPILLVSSRRLFTACSCSCWKSLSVCSKELVILSLLSAFCLLFSSTLLRNASNCSLRGFRSSPIWARLFSCSCSCLLASSCEVFFCISCLSVSKR